jgi:hypothetical protein
VRPLLHNASFVHDNDTINVADGRKPVSDNERLFNGVISKCGGSLGEPGVLYSGKAMHRQNVM